MSYVLWLGLLVTAPELVAPEDAGTRPPVRADARLGPRPVGFAVSGGSSLGAYMAGFTYLITEGMKKARSPLRTVLATGTSAGSVTALTTLFKACRPPNPDPMEDLGWRLWSRADHRKLFVPGEVTPVSIFSRTLLNDALDLAEQDFEKGLPKKCQSFLGITATRERIERVELAPELTVPRVQQRFSLRLQGNGLGRSPSFRNAVDVASAARPALLPTDSGTVPFDALRRAMLASAAIPVAFDAEEIAYCRGDGGPNRECPPAQRRHERFYDGGVFENTPLSFAVDLANGEFEGGADALDFVVVDPWVSAHPPLQTEEESKGDRLASLLSALGSEWLIAARSSELLSLLREGDSLRESVRLTRSRLPMAGKPISGLFGLFDWKFRHFDFYLGMFDAANLLRDWAGSYGIPVEFETLLPDGEMRVNWEPFACVVGHYDSERGDLRKYCDGPELEDFRILLQVSFDRVYARCRDADDRAVASSRHPHCRMAAAGKEPPRVVPALDSGPNRRGDEPEWHFYFRSLQRYGFEFSDLGLTREQADEAHLVFRRRLLDMLEALADQQPSPDREVVITASRALVNQFDYEPPANWIYVTLGNTSELGASLSPLSLSPWLRLNVAIGIQDLFELLTLEEDRLVFRAVAGPEIELLPLTSQRLQTMLGVRGGYQVGHGDRFATSDCDLERALGDRRLCSGWVVQSYAALGLLERFRLQVTGSWVINDVGFGTRRFRLGIGVGVQFF